MVTLWDRILQFFGLKRTRAEVQLQPSGLEYPSLDLDRVIADLEVRAMGSRNGASNIPRETERAPDGQEARIRQDLVRRVEMARARTTQLIHNLETSIKARQLAPAVKRCSEIPRNFGRELELRNARLGSELARLEGDHNELQEEVDRYRSRHGLERGPRLTDQEDRNLAIGLLGIFTTVQLGANAVLFGEGNDYGLALGITLAAIFAFFDILVHFNLGAIIARVQAPDTLNRLAGIGAALASVATVAAVNLAMVHLRLVTRREGISGWDTAWWPSIRDSPLGFQDFRSWGLLFVGVLCSSLALRSGFAWDEPIPLFRRNGNKLQRLQDDIEDVSEERLTLKAELLRRFQEELDQIDRRAEDHVSVIHSSVRRIDQVQSEFRSYCETARETGRAVVGAYRDENRRSRDTAPPPFFSDPVSIDFDDAPIVPLEPIERLVAQAERDHEELQRILPAARSELLRLAESNASTTELTPS